MPQTPQLSVAPSTTTSTSGSAKRRSVRIPRRSEEVVSSSGIGIVMGDKVLEKNVVQTNSLDSSLPPQEGWKHPAELQYIRRADWSQDLMITYLCQKAFTVPPRQINTTLSYTEITRSFSGEKIHIPRGYRIPLMFVAKFQWESLRLVLNSASEWEEYKFDIIHLSRLCTHFFKQAKSAASENKLTKGWRSPMFDRALIRFYRKWMVSREWSVKKFWEEYEEDEYKLDVLKFDWSRWVLKGHKGFVLTKEEVQNGVTADQYTDGLKRRPDGTWIWGGDDSGARATSLNALTCLASQDAVEAITDATSSHDSIEVKQELLGLGSDDVVLNINGKRLRGEDGDSPRKFSKRLSKNSNPPPKHKIFTRRKAAASIVPLFKSASSSSSGDEWQSEEDTAISKHAASTQSLPLTNNRSLKVTPLSLRARRKVVLTDKPGTGKSTPSTTTTMATIPTDVPSDHNLNPSPIPTSTDYPVGVSQFPKASTQSENVRGTILPASPDENRDEGISAQLPLITSEVGVLNPIPETRPKPLPTKPAELAQSEAGSSSLASGNHVQEGTLWTLVDPLMQSDNADPETMPNADVTDPATMNNPIIDALPNLLPQFAIFRRFGVLSSSDQLSSTNTTPTSPPSSLPEANTTLPMSGPIIIPTESLSSTSSNVPEVAHISVLSPSLPQNCAVTSDDSNGPHDPDSGDASRPSNSAFISELKVNFIQAVFDSVQKMSAPPRSMEPETITGSGIIDAEEEGKNKVEDTIVIPLSPVLSQSEEFEYPGNLTSGPGEVETVVVTQSEVGKVETEENGIESEVMNGEYSSALIPADTGSEGMDAVEGGKDTEGKKDMTDEMEVMDTIGDLVDGANGTHVRMDTFVTETRPLQSRQETPTVDNMDEAGVLLVKGGVEVLIESRQATPMNDKDGVGIASEVGAVEVQSIDSQSFTGAPTAPITDSEVPNNSVSSRGEFEGDPREVETFHAGNLVDGMDVDKEIVQPIQPTPPLLTNGSSPSSSLYMMRMKSLYSIQLLQGLTHFLRMPSQDMQLGVSRMLEVNSADLKSEGMCPVIEHARYLSLANLRLPTEEELTVDQRLDVLAHALAHVSVTLAKNLYPYRGKELETKIDILDKSLQQQFETIQKLDGRSCGEMYEPFKELGARPVTAFDPSTESTSTGTLSQGVQTSLPSFVNRQFESVEVQTEAENEVPAPQPLSADATMVDLTIHTPPFPESPSTPVAKAEYQPESNRSVAKTVMSIMRNMADLLECTTQGGSVKSLKGKEKEDTDVDMMPSYLDSPAFTTILEEFKSTKEEMRRSQHRSQSEVDSIRLSHFMEVEALKDEIRNIESKGKQELEEVTRQYSQQIRELKSTIRLKAEKERGGDREKESGSEKLPSLELLEIHRRVASLEERSRSDSISVDMLPSGSRPSMTNGNFQDPVISRHPPSHLLSTDFEEQPYTTFRAPGQLTRERSMSKPGTPASTDGNPFSNRHPEVTDLDESILLPAKSQRKMHMMNFLRPPIG